MTQEQYQSFVNQPALQPDYNCKNLEADGFKLKARCNKNNPDCQKFISDKEGEGFKIKTIDLDPAINQDYKNMVDVWVKENK